jgi:hypothetical protein
MPKDVCDARPLARGCTGVVGFAPSRCLLGLHAPQRKVHLPLLISPLLVLLREPASQQSGRRRKTSAAYLTPNSSASEAWQKTGRMRRQHEDRKAEEGKTAPPNRKTTPMRKARTRRPKIDPKTERSKTTPEMAPRRQLGPQHGEDTTSDSEEHGLIERSEPPRHEERRRIRAEPT